MMVFYYYEEAMQPVRKISVDGLAPNSFHLSHWIGNETPTDLKADTATEIALKFVSNPHHKSIFPHANIITNNHFDTDGLLSVFTLLHPKKAESVAPTLIAAAEAGDFSSFSSEEGVQINLLIEGLCSDQSPFRNQWAKSKGPKEAIFYKTLLPLLPDLFKKREEYRDLWRKQFDEIMASMELFERGAIGVEEYREERLTIIIDKTPPARQAVDLYCEGDYFLIILDQSRLEKAGKPASVGFGYELLYRYYSWAETVRRPAIPKMSMALLAEDLNRQETAAVGKWKTTFPGQSLTCSLKFVDDAGRRSLSALPPNRVAQSVLSHLQKDQKGTPRGGANGPVKMISQQRV